MADPKYKQIMYVPNYTSLPIPADLGQLAIDEATMITHQYNGTNWAPLGRPNVKKSAVQINAKTTGATLIYTLEDTGLTFYPAIIIPRVVNISGVTTAPTVSVGTNSTSYNNISSTSLLSNLLSTLSVGNGAPSTVNASPGLAGTTAIYANVTIGALATNYTVSYDILGYYF